VPVFNDKETYKFELGKGVTLREGNDVTIVATGLMVNEALQAHDMLKADGINARVVNIHTIKPLDTELINQCAVDTGLIITAEEHSIIGGLGSAVAETVAESNPVPVVKIGVNDVFGHSGPAVDLLKQFGLSAENIYNTTKSAIAKFKK
jgi:transketolase